MKNMWPPFEKSEGLIHHSQLEDISTILKEDMVSKLPQSTPTPGCDPFCNFFA